MLDDKLYPSFIIFCIRVRFWARIINQTQFSGSMCGIIGYFNTEDVDKQVSKLVAGLKLIQDRGKDACGISDGTKALTVDTPDVLSSFETKASGVVGHCLHSIVNVVPQPLNGAHGTLVVNCEIYNWKQLAEKYELEVQNDSELIIALLELKGVENITDVLDELDGVYAFAYLTNHKVYLARDIIGVKPLWFSVETGLSFCSESKVLVADKLPAIEELNPRRILVYDTKKDLVNYINRNFFEIVPEHKEKYEEMKKKVEGLLLDAVAKRVPDQKFGILFSGGVDSTIIALICKELGVDFVCYSAGLVEEGMKEPEDLIYSRKIAKELGFELRVNELKREDVAELLEKVVPLIEDNNVVKVGVALTFYAACELAREDGVRVIFSGLGSEEIFAGYERHKLSQNVNQECLAGIRKIYERDNYRDDVVTMNNNIELRVPFMDKELVKYCLKIPAKYKLSEKESKIILRDVSKDRGLPAEYADRPKKAAQYGSRFDKAIQFLTKANKFDRKSEYLRQFYPSANVRLAGLFSSGKDSCLALDIMRRQNYKIECLVTLRSKNPDSYMFHTPNINLAGLQADAMEIPIIIWDTEGEKEKELEDMKAALGEARMRYHIEGVVTGALFSTYQRDRVEKICDELGLKVFSPLWKMDQEKEMRMLLDSGFEFIFSSVAGEGLDKNWLGRPITVEDINKLVAVNKKVGINIAGEGGEFESLVLDGPMFRKKLNIVESELLEENINTARFVVKKAELVEK